MTDIHYLFQVAVLRRHLEDVASEEPYMGEQIPTRWLRFESAMTELVDAGTDFVTLSQVSLGRAARGLGEVSLGGAGGGWGRSVLVWQEGAGGGQSWCGRRGLGVVSLGGAGGGQGGGQSWCGRRGLGVVSLGVAGGGQGGGQSWWGRRGPGVSLISWSAQMVLQFTPRQTCSVKHHLVCRSFQLCHNSFTKTICTEMSSTV